MAWMVDTTKLDQFLRDHGVTQLEAAELTQKAVTHPEVNRLCRGGRPRPSVFPIANIYMALKQTYPELQFEDLCLREDGQA